LTEKAHLHETGQSKLRYVVADYEQKNIAIVASAVLFDAFGRTKDKRDNTRFSNTLLFPVKRTKTFSSCEFGPGRKSSLIRCVRRLNSLFLSGCCAVHNGRATFVRKEAVGGRGARHARAHPPSLRFDDGAAAFDRQGHDGVQLLFQGSENAQVD